MATSRRSPAMERTSQWVSTQDIPTDVIVEVGDASFSLHKFMLVAKSGLIKRRIMESSASDLARIVLPSVPGGAEAFEKAAEFCYGVNFEITVHNVVALRCAAEHLEMTDKYCEGNLAGRTDEFLKKAALNNLPSAVVVLRSCEAFLPLAEELKIVQRCVDAVSFKAYHESTFPTRSPPEWWAYEVASLGPSSFQKTVAALRDRAAAPQALATAVSAYAQKSLSGLLLSGSSTPSSPDPAVRSRQKTVVESIASVLPPESPFPAGFLCCLLRAAIFLEASAACRKELEKRVAAVLDQAAVGDLLTISLDYRGERIADLDSLRRVLAAFVESEGRGGVLYGEGAVCCSAALQKVARTVDGFCGEIATDEALSVSKFAGIAGVIPKSARRFDDDLYRAVDIFLKAHPGLEEIEREKACSVMDPLKLSYEARLHASQNKRLPVQVVLQSLYYDQLKLRGGDDGPEADKAMDRGGAASMRSHLKAADSSTLAEENEALRSELTKMKLYLSDLQKGGQGSSSSRGPKKPTFFSTVSKTLGKLNPFRQGSRDTSSIDDLASDVAPKPRRRRFSMS